MKTVEIFWTGGWDSTYRVLELVRNGYTVLPIYIIDANRNSWDTEIKAIGNLRTTLNKMKWGGEILGLNLVGMEKISEDDNITKAYHKIRKEIPIGSQYDWLARFAIDHPGVELCVEKPFGEYSGCNEAINLFGKLKLQDDVWVVDKENSSPELCLLFGNFSFPIIKLTEREMLANVKTWKCERIMKKIWFCHNPINGKPCGKCRPCQQKMECGMEFLLPFNAQMRYWMYKPFSLLKPILKKAYHFIKISKNKQTK